MPKACGNNANSLRIISPKTSEQPSTSLIQYRTVPAISRGQRLLFLFYFAFYHQLFPHARTRDLPLFEHCFYPLSTAPNTTLTK